MNTQHHIPAELVQAFIESMHKGFSIETDTGLLVIPPHEAAQYPAIRHEVETLLKYRLHQLTIGREVAA